MGKSVLTLFLSAGMITMLLWALFWFIFGIGGGVGAIFNLGTISYGVTSFLKKLPIWVFIVLGGIILLRWIK